jgi:hypothetical protein
MVAVSFFFIGWYALSTFHKEVYSHPDYGAQDIRLSLIGQASPMEVSKVEVISEFSWARWLSTRMVHPLAYTETTNWNHQPAAYRLEKPGWYGCTELPHINT